MVNIHATENGNHSFILLKYSASSSLSSYSIFCLSHFEKNHCFGTQIPFTILFRLSTHQLWCTRSSQMLRNIKNAASDDEWNNMMFLFLNFIAITIKLFILFLYQHRLLRQMSARINIHVCI